MLRHIFNLILCFLLLSPLSARADESLLLSPESTEEPLVATLRTPRPISRIAENVTVITSEQIAKLKVHTLEEVLFHVPGIQLGSRRTPGSWGAFSVNGLGFEHVLVILDGIVQNDLLNNFPDIGLIPAQQIERVEIVKGAASAAWGPALGGVINIVTKSPDPEGDIGGTALTTYGENGTTELNAELSGTLDRFGYYLGGGHLHSKGLRLGNGINFNHGWLKLAYDLPSRGTVTLGGGVRDSFRGLEASVPLNYKDTDDTIFYHGFIEYSQPLGNNLGIELSARHQSYQDKVIWGSIVPDPLMPPWVFPVREIFSIASAKLRWDTTTSSLLFGTNIEHQNLTDATGSEKNLNRWATYLNGSWTSGRFTLLPGIRFDHTALGRNPLSITLGATWQFNDKTVVRGYAAQGYGLPTVSNSHNVQKIRTVQLGAESSLLPAVWLKGTIFYNYLWDIEPSPGQRLTQVRQGVELEARSLPLHDFTLGAAYTYSDNRDKDSHDPAPNTPEQSLKASLDYKSSFGLCGVLSANYVWWNPDSYPARYSSMIWNLSLTQKLLPLNDLSPEIFFTGHNLFNGSQYINDLYKNTPRWIEGGVRFKF